MRKLLIGMAGATALALSSAANATITINSSTGLATAPSVVNTATQSTVGLTANQTVNGTWSASVDFTNDLSGIYSLLIGTSTPGSTITGFMLQNSAQTTTYFTYSGSPFTNNTFNLGSLAAGDYLFTFNGNNTSTEGGVTSANLTFSVAAVPEPATWALMLLGFAGVGFAMRRSRKPALAQLA